MVPALPSDPSDEELARGFAMQLCALRAFGVFVDDISRIPIRIANHVGRQVGVAPALFIADPDRAATDTAHTQRIRSYLGYRAFDDEVHERLRATLEERAAAGATVSELLEHARAVLRTWKVEAPARSTLDRLVGASAARAATEAWEVIARRLSGEFCTAVDALLLKEEDGRSALFRLKEYPPEPKAQVILEYLGRAARLREMGVGALDFSGVRADIVIHLAELARRYDVDDLKRFSPAKRYAMAACFLADAQRTVLDHLVEMHHVFLTGLHRRAQNAYDDQQKQLRQRSSRNLFFFNQGAFRHADDYEEIMNKVSALMDQRAALTTHASKRSLSRPRFARGRVPIESRRGSRCLHQRTSTLGSLPTSSAGIRRS
jgi:hypothetical protein